MSKYVSSEDFTITYDPNNQQVTVTPGDCVDPRDFVRLSNELYSRLSSIVKSISQQFSLDDELTLSTPDDPQPGSPIFSVDLSEIKDEEVAQRTGYKIRGDIGFAVTQYLWDRNLARLPSPEFRTPDSLGKRVVDALGVEHLVAGTKRGELMKAIDAIVDPGENEQYVGAIMEAISGSLKKEEGMSGKARAIIEEQLANKGQSREVAVPSQQLYEMPEVSSNAADRLPLLSKMIFNGLRGNGCLAGAAITDQHIKSAVESVAFPDLRDKDTISSYVDAVFNAVEPHLKFAERIRSTSHHLIQERINNYLGLDGTGNERVGREA